MSEKCQFARLSDAFVIQITGADARRILNNLTTNNIAELQDNCGCETFVTNGKGWTVAHGLAYNHLPENSEDPSQIWLAGQHPTPGQITEHIDRYIIREDAQVKDATAEATLVLGRALPAELFLKLGPLPATDFHFFLSQNEAAEAFLAESTELSEEDFEVIRIRAGWPRQGREILEKTIPQEIDRDESAISFTKGCYLGQETIARLDALGQLQRKLCVLTCEAPTAAVNIGDELEREGKSVGKLSSIAKHEAGLVAMATIKRGSFESGSELQAAGNTWKVV